MPLQIILPQENILASLNKINAGIDAANRLDLVKLNFADVFADYMTGINAPVSANRTTTVPAGGFAYVRGNRVSPEAFTHEYPAFNDSYVALHDDASYTIHSVANGAAAPVEPATGRFVLKVVTNASAILQVTKLMVEIPTVAAILHAPTPALGTNTQQVATTAFVKNAFDRPWDFGQVQPGKIRGTSGQFDEDLNVTGFLKVNTNKFIVDPATGNVTISGQLIVSGGGSSTNVDNLAVSNQLIFVNDVDIVANPNAPVPATPSGFAVKRGALEGVARDKAGFAWDEASSTFVASFLNASGAYVSGGELGIKAKTLQTTELATLASALVQGTFSVAPGQVTHSPLFHTDDLIQDYVVSGYLMAAGGGLAAPSVPAGIAYAGGQRVQKTAATVLGAFTANRDVYVDLTRDGTFTVIQVANGAAVPAVTANAVRLFKAVTGGSTITSVTDLRVLKTVTKAPTFQVNDLLAVNATLTGDLSLQKQMASGTVNNLVIKLGNLNADSVNANASYAYKFATSGNASGAAFKLVSTDSAGDTDVISVLNKDVTFSNTATAGTRFAAPQFHLKNIGAAPANASEWGMRGNSTAQTVDFVMGTSGVQYIPANGSSYPAAVATISAAGAAAFSASVSAPFTSAVFHRVTVGAQPANSSEWGVRGNNTGNDTLDFIAGGDGFRFVPANASSYPTAVAKMDVAGNFEATTLKGTGTGASSVGGAFTATGLLTAAGASLTKNAETLSLYGTDHNYIGFYPRGSATGRKAYVGYSAAAAVDLDVANEDTGNLNLRAGTAGAVNVARGSLAMAGTAVIDANLDFFARDLKFTGKLITSKLANIVPLYIRGTGLNNTGARVLTIGSSEVYNTATGRGLTLTILTKSTMTVVSTTTYDTHAAALNADNLATALNALTKDQIGVLTSYDAWEGFISANLRAAFLRLGLVKAAIASTTVSRRPYAAVFEAGTTVADNKVVEVLNANDAGAPFAEIRGWMIDGAFVANGDAPSHLTNNIGTITGIMVDEAGNVGVGMTPTSITNVGTTGTLSVAAGLSFGTSGTNRIGSLSYGASASSVGLGANAYHDGTNWQRMDTARASSLLWLPNTANTTGNALELYRKNAATGAISWDTLLTVDGSGNLVATGTLKGTELQLDNVYTRSVERTLPTIVGHAVNIGTFTAASESTFWISLIVNGVSASIAKQYLVPARSGFGSNNVWVKVLPLSNTGIYSGNDVDLEMRINNDAVEFRILKTAGTSAGLTAKAIIRQEGGVDTFVASTTSAAVTPGAINFIGSPLTQSPDGHVGVNVMAPAQKLGVADLAANAEAVLLGLRNLHNATAAQTSTASSIVLNWNDSSGNEANGVKILAGKEADYTDAASKRNSFLAFYTTAANVLAERARITSAGHLVFGADTSSNWYRSAAGTVKTDGNLIAAGTITQGANRVLDTANNGTGTTATKTNNAFKIDLNVATISALGGVYVPSANGLSVAADGKLAIAQASTTGFGAVQVTAGNGLGITAGVLSLAVGDTATPGAVKVTNGNGLSITTGTIAMAEASTTAKGGIQVTAGNGLGITGGVLSMAVGDTATPGAVKVTNGNGLTITTGTIAMAVGSTAAKGAVQVTAGNGLSITTGTIAMAVGDTATPGAVKVTAANGLSITSGTIAMALTDGTNAGTVKVTTGNGLGLTTGTLSMAQASTTGFGTVQITAGNGLGVTSGVLSLALGDTATAGAVKVTNGNGLSITTGTIAMAVGSTSAKGAVQVTAGNGLSITTGTIAMAVGDTSTPGAVKVTAGNGLSITTGTIAMAAATQAANGAMPSTDKVKVDNMGVRSTASVSNLTSASGVAGTVPDGTRNLTAMPLQTGMTQGFATKVKMTTGTSGAEFKIWRKNTGNTADDLLYHTGYPTVMDLNEVDAIPWELWGLTSGNVYVEVIRGTASFELTSVRIL